MKFVSANEFYILHLFCILEKLGNKKSGHSSPVHPERLLGNCTHSYCHTYKLSGKKTLALRAGFLQLDEEEIVGDWHLETLKG